ncbi:MAG: 1-deoxy-D-xylulose-5-phosphate reductoisomerase [Clostridia bacterium]|nr:1-deoxy-D-xylulose-5-phosphate reductoisomerase [Clostridia bacterium]MBR3955240.1 1-deoxy-D-xylulose-5-phosphate reductoisomerase [Clostridia bacterium]
MMKKIAILGATGSIGLQAIDVIEKQGYKSTALTANTDSKKMETLIRRCKPQYAAMASATAANDLRIRVADTDTKILSGTDGVCECAALAENDICLNAIVGMAGLRPTLSALKNGITLALANKESLVAGGDLVKNTAKENNVKILPVDSEHSAIFQCLAASPQNGGLKKIILTASGGPFFGKTKDELKNVSIRDALKHPNWSMGAKITVDSASMFNKGLELIEACHLFDVTPDQVDIIVHRESILHSAVEFADGAVIAQLGVPDMRIPIQYALTYPDRFESPSESIDFAKLAKMTFFDPDEETFDCLSICREAFKKGGLYPTAVNAANEEANRLFREEKVSFLQISELIRTAFSIDCAQKTYTLEMIEDVEREARQRVLNRVGI